MTTGPARENALRTALEGRYSIVREIGEGGMATVYLSHDLRHDRRVAVKLLHPDLAAALGAERFLAEIKTTANLQHPHILPLHDSGEAGGFLFYVMPFVEGESLRARLTRERQLPIDEAIRFAQQVANALDYAHRHGVIHRDIKPENILLHEGSALVADFGIALAVQTAGGQRMTQTGLSLGTPQYMSPEQAMGEKTIDARSDIYSLAAVTYEMFVGEPPFTGATTQAVVAKVIAAEPQAVTMTRRNVPAAAATAVHRGLEKVPADRYATAAEFSTALTSASTEAFTPSRSQAPPSVVAKPGYARELIIGAGILVAALAFLTGRFTARDSDGAGASIVATLAHEPDERWQTSGVLFSVSPDGRRLVIRSGASLVIRSLDSLVSQALPGTTDAVYPFWSPDAGSIGFFAGNQLKTINVATGSVRGLCPSTRPAGGTWSEDGTILFVPERTAGPFVVKSSGGECTPLAVKGPPSVLNGRPYLFPDGKHFIITSDLFAYIGEIGGDSIYKLVDLGRQRAVFAPPFFLLYTPAGAPENAIFAHKIDVGGRRLVGEPVKIIERVPKPGGQTSISASGNGTIVARQQPAGVDGRRIIARFPRLGAVQDTVSTAGTFGPVRLSRDGKRLASAGFRLDLLDLERRATTSIVRPTDLRALSQYPQWSPGDTAIAYIARDTFAARINVINVKSGGLRTLPGEFSGRSITLTDWSHDGRYLAYVHGAGGPARFDEGAIYDVSTSKASKLVEASGDVGEIRIAPTGRHVAYVVGGNEVYIMAFPEPALPVRVAPGAARSPQWRNDGRELYYIDESGAIVAVGVRDDGSLALKPEVVVTTAALRAVVPTGVIPLIEASSDGRTFYAVFSPGSDNSFLTLVTNWWKRAGVSAR